MVTAAHAQKIKGQPSLYYAYAEVQRGLTRPVLCIDFSCVLLLKNTTVGLCRKTFKAWKLCKRMKRVIFTKAWKMFPELEHSRLYFHETSKFTKLSSLVSFPVAVSYCFESGYGQSEMKSSFKAFWIISLKG